MEPIEFALVAIAIPFLSKYVEKPGEKLGENTTKQLAKLAIATSFSISFLFELNYYSTYSLK